MAGRRKQPTGSPPKIMHELVLYYTGEVITQGSETYRIIAMRYDLENSPDISYKVKKKS